MTEIAPFQVAAKEPHPLEILPVPSVGEPHPVSHPKIKFEEPAPLAPA